MGLNSEMQHRSSLWADLVFARCGRCQWPPGANGHRDGHDARCRGDLRSPARTTECIALDICRWWTKPTKMIYRFSSTFITSIPRSGNGNAIIWH